MKRLAVNKKSYIKRISEYRVDAETLVLKFSNLRPVSVIRIHIILMTGTGHIILDRHKLLASECFGMLKFMHSSGEAGFFSCL